MLRTGGDDVVERVEEMRNGPILLPPRRCGTDTNGSRGGAGAAKAGSRLIGSSA
jgi:hypothetical protein